MADFISSTSSSATTALLASPTRKRTRDSNAATSYTRSSSYLSTCNGAAAVLSGINGIAEASSIEVVQPITSSTKVSKPLPITQPRTSIHQNGYATPTTHTIGNGNITTNSNGQNSCHSSEFVDNRNQYAVSFN